MLKLLPQYLDKKVQVSCSFGDPITILEEQIHATIVSMIWIIDPNLSKYLFNSDGQYVSMLDNNALQLHNSTYHQSRDLHSVTVPGGLKTSYANAYIKQLCTTSNMGHLFVVGEFVVVSHRQIFPLQLLHTCLESVESAD